MTPMGLSTGPKEALFTNTAQKHHQPLQIFFWRKIGNIPSQFIDVSDDASAIYNDNAPVANLLFFTGEGDKEEETAKYPIRNGYQHNLILNTNNPVYRQWQAEGHSAVLCVKIEMSFLQLYVPQSTAFKKLHEQMTGNFTGKLSAAHLAITPDISAVLNDILECRKKGIYRSFYLQAKVIELLALQFEQHEQQTKKAAKHLPIDATYLEKMHRVRDILLNDLNTGLSLKELANEVGTNEFDLKKNFKKVFGNTVFGYLHQHKMEQAKKMLINTQAKIATIAEFMGYKHATHFTTAFKKYFGYLPNKLKILLMCPWSELDILLELIGVTPV